MPDDELLLDEQHPVSKRFAILEDDGTSCWLYLTRPNDQAVAADAWVFNRIAPPSPSEVKVYRGGPPPAAKGYVSASAVCETPLDYEWTFLWSADGESVAIEKDGQPVAFIVAGQEHGYSRELIKDGPWGQKWSAERLRETF